MEAKDRHHRVDIGMSATAQVIAAVGAAPHAWILRSGAQHARYGDPYTMACVALRETDTLVRIEALADGAAPRDMIALRHVLRALGFTHATWSRMRNVRVQL